jgi:uncharacterized protein DUF6653
MKSGCDTPIHGVCGPDKLRYRFLFFQFGIGWWSLIPIMLSAIWIWINPRVFKKPISTKNWASMAVLGERVGLNRKAFAVPEHFEPVIRILSTISCVGTVVCILGLVIQSFWMTIFGMAVLILSKSWFLDRMVWLYQEMKDTDDEYGRWLYSTLSHCRTG